MSLLSIFVSVLCLAVLIGWHELGHFVAARACGVQVLRFSIGFGKALLSWTDRAGTCYTLSVIPFGGYVRMLGEDALSDESEESEKSDKAFSSKPVWQRLIIVLAGPFANILLAFFIFIMVNLAGITRVTPVIGNITPESPAFYAAMHAGEKITAIDGVAVSSWKDLSLQLVNRIGDTGMVVVMTVADNQSESMYQLEIHNWLDDAIDPDPLRALGIEPFRPVVEAVIYQVQSDGAAAKAGLQPQDRILVANQNAVSDWRQLVDIIRQSPSIPVELVVERRGQELQFVLVPDPKADQQEIIGFAGIGTQSVNFPEDMLLRYEPNLFEATGQALVDTFVLGRLIIVSIYKLVRGDIALGNVSGPIGIVKIAGHSASAGLLAFLSFTAYLSISLGILNLLPIPVLDGGQALFLCIEGLTGREVPRYWQSLAMRFGIFFLVGIMLLATIYDIYKL